ncbi:hypothetical protein BV25DRAFT_1533403 [Artomyces pyxidatus]|uniref:Uncharacterized protein n=1 Tax=Artomyces pyxidatus TaxID=48021 RepID=A0ACB8SK26_9AGAM|nr:hypothetical protein BV25DRAFT_1533403 [Artomyces pyxidatus]
MSRIDSTVQHIEGASESPGFRQDKSRRQDRDSSRSDSEESYQCRGSSKTDGEASDDHNTQLTAQTLNADGTPKRPMNAFMIFARRRRPQVSAANQTMRTGEISKILSKEWNAMDTSDKQFYLDQAKRLKETFNSKYPDYVYRRRPNNSRKKRRSDAPPNPLLDPSVSGDAGEDFPLPEFDYAASIDGEDPMVPSVREARGSTHHSGMPAAYDDGTTSLPSSQYSYSNTDSYPSSHAYASSSRPSQSHFSTRATGSDYTDVDHHTYPTHQNHSQPALYASETSASAMWHAPTGVMRSEHTRPAGTSPGWPLAPPLLAGQQRASSALLSKSEAFSPSPHRPWSNASSAAPSQTYPLQTLSSPFFPSQAQSHSPSAYQSSTSSSSTPSAASPETYFGQGTTSSSYGSRAPSYTEQPLYHSHSMSASPFPLGGNDDPPHHPRARLPSLHHAQMGLHDGVSSLSTPSSSGDSHSSSHLAFWERTKLEGP